MSLDLILRVGTKLILPFILLFALYVQFHGDFGPGGGFQAGVITAGMVILLAIIFGLKAAKRIAPPALVERMVPLGVLIYAGTGVAGLLLGKQLSRLLRASPTDPRARPRARHLCRRAGVLVTVVRHHDGASSTRSSSGAADGRSCTAFAGHYNYVVTIFLMVAGPLHRRCARQHDQEADRSLDIPDLGLSPLHRARERSSAARRPIIDPAFKVYSNPLPHVLILTAIVVGVATLALGLALVVRITGLRHDRGGRDLREGRRG